MPAVEIAAALAKLPQGDVPLLLEPPDRGAREERAPHQRNERSNDRGERPARSSRASSVARAVKTTAARVRRVRKATSATATAASSAPRAVTSPRAVPPEAGMETFRIEVGHATA